MPAQYITPQEASEMLSVSVDKMSRWIRIGSVQGYRLLAHSLGAPFVRTTIEDVTFAIKPVNKERTREDFIRECMRNYHWYFARNPKRRISDEELARYLEDFIDGYLPDDDFSG
jgi:hypothetical protein